jgi:hypothetical protein
MTPPWRSKLLIFDEHKGIYWRSLRARMQCALAQEANFLQGGPILHGKKPMDQLATEKWDRTHPYVIWKPFCLMFGWCKYSIHILHVCFHIYCRSFRTKYKWKYCKYIYRTILNKKSEQLSYITCIVSFALKIGPTFIQYLKYLHVSPLSQTQGPSRMWFEWFGPNWPADDANFAGVGPSQNGVPPKVIFLPFEHWICSFLFVCTWNILKP